MKNLFLFPLLLLTYLCIAQQPSSASIIGKPRKFGNLLVAQYDFPKVMNWSDAKKACAELGDGWRLPTKDELNSLYLNKYEIGFFTDDGYWSATEVDNSNAWLQFFSTGYRNNGVSKNNKFDVRAVRSL